jgi:predicted Zn-dependent protease
MIMHVVQRGALLDGGAGMVAKLKTFDAALIGEQEVNEAGYTLLELGHAREAIPLLQWNVERFPKSQNTYDSLAQAYYDIGDREKALANYKRSFELEPKNLNAKKMIELLR